MNHDPLADLGILTRRHHADVRLRWTRHGYVCSLECAAGHITPTAGATAEEAAVRLLECVPHWTRRDGTVEWVRWRDGRREDPVLDALLDDTEPMCSAERDGRDELDDDERLVAQLGASVAVNEYRRGAGR